MEGTIFTTKRELVILQTKVAWTSILGVSSYISKYCSGGGGVVGVTQLLILANIGGWGVTVQ